MRSEESGREGVPRLIGRAVARANTAAALFARVEDQTTGAAPAETACAVEAKLVDAGALADLLALRRGTAYPSRTELPPPLLTVGRRQLWRADEVEAWVAGLPANERARINRRRKKRGLAPLQCWDRACVRVLPNQFGELRLQRRRYPDRVAAVVFKLADRGYGLDQHQAQFLAGQLRRRLTVPEPVAHLADQIWAQSMRNPDAGETSQDIELDTDQKRELLETLMRVRPEGDVDAWDALRDALQREVGS